MPITIFHTLTLSLAGNQSDEKAAVGTHVHLAILNVLGPLEPLLKSIYNFTSRPTPQI